MSEKYPQPMLPPEPERPPPQETTSPHLINIPPRVDPGVIVIRMVAALLSSLSLSLSTDATNRQMAAQACLAVATVLFGLVGDLRGKFRHTRRYDRRRDEPPPGSYGG